MENERLFKQTIRVYTEIVRKTADPTFRFPKGGAVVRTLSNFFRAFREEFGTITPERLTDVCVSTAYAYRDKPSRTINQLFGPSSIKRIRENKHGVHYYEDQWLRSAGLSRKDLVKMVVDRSVHANAKYIYMPSEECTKRRFLNQETGYALCQFGTLGWSPLSETCGQCLFTDRCKGETKRKYHELYRIRLEYEVGKE
jgi:hypothetical protein